MTYGDLSNLGNLKSLDPTGDASGFGEPWEAWFEEFEASADSKFRTVCKCSLGHKQRLKGFFLCSRPGQRRMKLLDFYTKLNVPYRRHMFCTLNYGKKPSLVISPTWKRHEMDVSLIKTRQSESWSSPWTLLLVTHKRLEKGDKLTHTETQTCL